MYILSIVGIVAIVAIAVLLMNGIDYGSSNDLSGQVIKAKTTCGDGICKSPETIKNCAADCKPKDNVTNPKIM